MDDEKIAELIRAGDTETFIRIVSQYKKLLWVIAGGILNKAGTSEDVEECISDVFVQLWQNPKAFDPSRGSLKAYLAVVARSKALDRYRQLTKLKIVELDEAVNSPDDDLFEHIAQKELHKELYAAIRTLGEPDCEILVRRYFFGEMPAGIARKTALPVKEVKNRLYQSKLKLRRLLGEKGVYTNG